MRWTKIRRSRLSCCDFATSIFVSIFYASHAALVASPYGQQRRRQRWSIFISGGRASGAVPRESRLTDRAVSGHGPRLTDRRRPVMTVSGLTLFVVTDRPSRRRRRIRAGQAGRQAQRAALPACLAVETDGASLLAVVIGSAVNPLSSPLLLLLLLPALLAIG